ncbi:MAG TPA: ADP-ribosylglycohydrolase family protein [Acidobacteriota bacterium]|nr:ADP-ribosylglycohydrolase family protein [Acidobacteriota bacterium]
MNRRTFLQHGVVLPAAIAATQGSLVPSQGSSRPAGRVSLREKFFGCIAACHVGSAMGAPCEGWLYERIEAKYGTIDRLLPYQHYSNGWQREPGTTEDGCERQKLMITAISEKKDRVNAEDVRKIWVRDMRPEQAGMISEPFEMRLLEMAKSGIPACDIGRYCDYAGLNSFARSCHPIGLINAGDVAGAVTDVFEVGQLYQTTNSRGLQWAAVTGMAIAAATKPAATVDSVFAAIHDGDPRFGKDFGEVRAAQEIERALALTKDCRSFREMRKAFDSVYSGSGTPYAFSSANEVVTKALSIFRMVQGNPKEAIIAAVNLGRDTDCLAAIAGGISGALSGAGELPEEWLKQVDYATTKMPVTNNRRTLREHADGLFEAYRARLRKMRAFADEMENA